MADTGVTVWAAGFWADDVWAVGFWSSQAPVTVPDVVGNTQAIGTATLQGVGFVVVVVTASSNVVPVGSIISQVPIGGSSANFGSAVTITVSLGDLPTGGGRSRSKKSFDEARKYSDRIRKQLDDVLEDVSEIYRELIDGPQIFAKEAAQIVKPFAAPKAKTIPQPAIIDWKALERDSERVGKLVSLWLKQQRRLEMLHADDEWMMLGD